jgi:hypothetical protein
MHFFILPGAAANGGRFRRNTVTGIQYNYRISCHAKNSMIDMVFAKLQEKQIFRIRIEVLSMDSTGVKIHPDAVGAHKKTVLNRSVFLAEAETSKFILLPRVTEYLLHFNYLAVNAMMHRKGGCCRKTDTRTNRRNGRRYAWLWTSVMKIT